MPMKSKIENTVLLMAYTLFAVGQVWLYVDLQNEPDLYSRVTLHGLGWSGAHILLMVSSACMLWSAKIVYNKLKSYRGRRWAFAGLIFVLFGGLSLLSQFAIDLYLTELFTENREESYASLTALRSGFVKFVCYDLVAAWLLGMICMGIASWVSNVVPRWSILVLFMALVLVLVGPSIHPLVSRLNYVLFTVALVPFLHKGQAANGPIF